MLNIIIYNYALLNYHCLKPSNVKFLPIVKIRNFHCITKFLLIYVDMIKSQYRWHLLQGRIPWYGFHKGFPPQWQILIEGYRAFAARIWLFGQYLREITGRYPTSRLLCQEVFALVEILITLILPMRLIWSYQLIVWIHALKVILGSGASLHLGWDIVRGFPTKNPSPPLNSL